jgi:hypothetical protein
VASRENKWWDFGERMLPVVALVPASMALGWLAWRLFFHWSAWLWAQQTPVDLKTITRWALPQFGDADGAEPVALIGLVVVATIVLSALAHLLPRANRRVHAAFALLSLLGAYFLLQSAHFDLPLAEVGPSHKRDLAIVAGAVAASLLIGWGPRSSHALAIFTALLLVPIAFLPSAGPSAGDAAAIVAPALRLLHGVAPKHVYMQYDYLPSLLLEAWLWLGGDASGVFFIAGVSFYALLLGLLALARRWFAHPGLAGPLLVAVVIVRIYAVMGDEVAVPQVAPLRLDLWLLPVALALRFGLRHWAVALSLGLLCIFSRSIGVLYLGGYALAVGGDFLAARLAVARAQRMPWRSELGAFLRQQALNAGILLVCLGAATLILGSPFSDAVLLYRKLGVSQLKIPAGSFYWWLLPLNALTGALAFVNRGELGERKGGAALLTVGLLISSSIYFFGRSHENNLINLSVPFLLCFFLALDLWLLNFRRGTMAPRALQMVLASGLVVLCAWQYSGRVWTKLDTQMAVVNRSELIGPLFVPQFSPMYCAEVDRAAPDHKVYFFASLDSWFYARCGYRPPSYQQPVGLSIVKAPLVAEISHLLDRGFTIAMYKGDGAMVSCFFEDYQAGVAGSGVTRTDSPHWTFVTRGATPPPPPRRRPVRRRRRRRPVRIPAK